MFEIIPKRNGKLPKPELMKLGGQYSLLERWSLKGIGSPKFTYLSGFKPMDIMNRDVSGEDTFLNIEILKKGIILRIYAGQRQKAFGLLFKDLIRIEINKSKESTKLAIYGSTSHDEYIIRCLVNRHDHKNTIAFFYKDGLKEKVHLN
jgi:hypothetical protein